MNTPVIIKGNAHGIKLVLNDSIDFEDLKKHIEEKFKESNGFFKDADMVLEFEGRELSEDEEQQILEIIENNSSINIVYILNKDIEKEIKYKNLITANNNKKISQEKVNNSNSGDFYKGTLRSGQVLESNNSIVILGDVNPGAKIVAGENVVVLGSLKGIVYSGMSGNEASFVVALEMKPQQIKICDIIARSPDKIKDKEAHPETKIAFIEDDNIYIEPLSKEVLNDIKF